MKGLCFTLTTTTTVVSAATTALSSEKRHTTPNRIEAAVAYFNSSITCHDDGVRRSVGGLANRRHRFREKTNHARDARDRLAYCDGGHGRRGRNGRCVRGFGQSIGLRRFNFLREFLPCKALIETSSEDLSNGSTVRTSRGGEREVYGKTINHPTCGQNRVTCQQRAYPDCTGYEQKT